MSLTPKKRSLTPKKKEKKDKKRREPTQDRLNSGLAHCEKPKLSMKPPKKILLRINYP